VVPPEYQALIAGIQRSKANNTRKLIDALRPLEDLGMSQSEAIALGFGRFPVAGYATFVDDWWFPRFVPSFHLHQGTDIFAAAGTPVRSPVDGVLRQANGPVGGLAAYVTQDDGSYVYMAHLAGFAPGFKTGDRVKVGDVVGYVGDTGNARGGSPHVHFQLHPAPTKTVTTRRPRWWCSRSRPAPCCRRSTPSRTSTAGSRKPWRGHRRSSLRTRRPSPGPCWPPG
jgi:murein DD-endopeptidase MepM/ murein hydrolase activator NlpD